MQTKDYPTIECKECGITARAAYVDEVRDEMVNRSLCFTCNFWTNWVERDKTDTNSVVVDGSHYHIADEHHAEFGFRGFGGARFKILFNDGREVVSTNLWHQGDIPEHFKSRIPNNAQFIK